MADDSRITKLAAEIGRTMRVHPANVRETAVLVLRQLESAGLAVVDPMAAPYSLVTHEYPPTVEIAKAQIDYLANTNHALHMHLRNAWDQGHAAGWTDCAASFDATQDRGPDPDGTPNPYKQEASDG